jgi:hypothetical protein
MRYYVNRVADDNGDHEVHVQTCHKLPFNRIDLGDHSSCRPAVQAARSYYSTADGCALCSPACHSG